MPGSIRFRFSKTVAGSGSAVKADLHHGEGLSFTPVCVCARIAPSPRDCSGLPKVSDSSSVSSSKFRRPLVLCLCLLAALIAANLVYSAIISDKPVLSGSHGELLYVATFSDFEGEWDLFEGTQSAQIIDEQLAITVTDAQVAVWSAAAPRFKDFDLSVTARAQAGPIDNAFGILFYLNDAESRCGLPAVILCGIGDLLPLAGAALRQIFEPAASQSYLAFLISSDGYYSLWRREAGQSAALSAWIPSPHITQGLGKINRLGMVARGGSYQFSINGEPARLCIPDDRDAASTYAGGQCIDGSLQDAYHDTERRSGRLGMIAQTTATGGGGLAARFDDLIVHAPGSPNDGEARL